MSGRTIIVVFLALFSGAGMAVGVLQANRAKNGGPVSTTQTEDVLIAVENLERGIAVKTTQVEVRQWIKGYAPADTLRSPKAAEGRAVVGRVLAGELVREVKLAKDGAGLGLAPAITVGMRAVTVMATRVATNVAGFVLPGSKVDVLLNLRGGGRGDETGGGSTTTLMQAVEVLAVDEKQEAPETNQFDPRKLASVTLLVSPKQANVLDLAQNMGTLSLALRNSSDVSNGEVEAATLAEISRLAMPPNPSLLNPVLDGDVQPPPGMAIAPPPPQQTEKKEPVWIVTWRGNQRGRVALTGGQE
jgi:pilus assembly protein CpaB